MSAMTSSYIDERIINAVRQSINRIENQHNLLLSVLLSVLFGVVCSRVIEVSLWHGVAILSDGASITNLILFIIITFIIGFLLIVSFYIFFRGGYSATFTLVFSISGFSEDWRTMFKEVLTKLSTKFNKYGIYSRGCREVDEVRDGERYEYLICHYIYKGSIPLEIKLYSFKTVNIIPLTITLIANPFKVIAVEFCNSPLLNMLRFHKEEDHYEELDIWYSTSEDLYFSFDDIEKELQSKNILLRDAIA